MQIAILKLRFRISDAMVLTIRLEDENGVPIEEPLDDIENLLTRLIPTQISDEFHLLPYIDWNGDTTFNRTQISRFIEEWDKLHSRSTIQAEIELLNKVRGLAEFCKTEPHFYLKFYAE